MRKRERDTTKPFNTENIGEDLFMGESKKDVAEVRGLMSECKFDKYVEDCIDINFDDSRYKSFKQVLRSCKCEKCKKFYKEMYLS